MNITEKRYAVKRIDAIAARAIGELKEPKHHNYMNREECYDMIASGKVKLLSKAEFLRGYADYAHDFSAINKTRLAEYDAKVATWNKERWAIEDRASAVRDEVMLGDDSAAALASITAFAASFK